MSRRHRPKPWTIPQPNPRTVGDNMLLDEDAMSLWLKRLPLKTVLLNPGYRAPRIGKLGPEGAISGSITRGE